MFDRLRAEGTNLEEVVQQEFSREAPLFKLAGFKITRVAKGEANMSFSTSEINVRRGGLIHGGVVMYALDTVCGLSVMTVNRSTDQVTLELKVNFLAPLLNSPYLAHGKVLRAGGRTVVAEGEVFDSAGKLCAKALGTWYIVGSAGNAK